MKKLYLFPLLCLLIFACKTQKEVVAKVEKKQIDVLFLADQCTDTDPLSLFKFNGIGFDKIKALQKIGKDSFALKVDEGEPRFMYIGTDAQAKLPVIFSNENLNIKGSCKSIRSSKIINSELNTKYSSVLKTIREQKRAQQAKLGEFRRKNRYPDQQKPIVEALKKLDEKHLAFLDTTKAQNPFIAHIVGLGTMVSFPNKAAGYNNNEVEFFAAEFFANADLRNPVYNEIPYLFESFKEYAQTLASVGLPKEMLERLLDQNLNLIPDSTYAMRYALGGVTLGLQGKNNPSFAIYGNRFIEKFGDSTDSASVDRLKTQLDQAKSFLSGAAAPEIVMASPEGDELKLSDLKGKVVLIDFWASWCGPCRRENPNVVKAYNKYKADGFEILGVSLDRTKSKWLAAIEKDGLTWLHVSDLKGWQNAAAQTYGVRSIPHTVLVDREGKIIARNLRGGALERKLEEVLK